MNTKIDLAEQQLLGYAHAKRGYSLIDLITSMGLTIKEWEVIKKDYPNYLNEDETAEIEDYFESQKAKSQSKSAFKIWAK